jgi:hypothetical protein
MTPRCTARRSVCRSVAEASASTIVYRAELESLVLLAWNFSPALHSTHLRLLSPSPLNRSGFFIDRTHHLRCAHREMQR